MVEQLLQKRLLVSNKHHQHSLHPSQASLMISPGGGGGQSTTRQWLQQIAAATAQQPWLIPPRGAIGRLSAVGQFSSNTQPRALQQALVAQVARDKLSAAKKILVSTKTAANRP
ncbi:hypothetical protein TKK_0019243 [Trichogramma kaykai]|uniref:Uncharacterized protein n=1 Tax=Trichogramma kaykai TaxID=54128 RepID=A0ABD2VU73_9HYME